jgi:hypothetical protein
MSKTEYKVVRILDEYRIIINAGTGQGITENDIFQIPGAGDNIYDPDTKELLGSLPVIKASVTPIEIFEKMSICKNVKVISSWNETLLGISATLTPKATKLNVDKSQMSNPELYEPIRVGDKLILIKGTTSNRTLAKPSSETKETFEAKELKSSQKEE